jgi:hypothetical protein
MPEDRLPLRLVPTAEETAQQAYDDALEAFDGPKEALEAIGGYIKRMKEGRRGMAYDSRWRGARDTRARDQGNGGGEELADLESMLKELIGEDRARPVMKYIHDCRAAGAADQPPDFQGKPLTGGGMVPTTGSLTVDPNSSKSANAASSFDHLPPSLRREAEALAIFKDGRAMRSYAERFPGAMRLGRAG